MDASKLSTPLAELADKGAPSLEVATNHGRATVSVFATQRNVDPDAIFGPAAKDGTKPSPVLNPTTGQAWVKLEVHAGTDGKAGIGFGNYFPAALTATLAEALRQANGLPSVRDAADMRRLAPGHLAYLSMDGTLSGKLQFNWADVLTGEATPLRGLLPGDQPLNLAVDLKANLAAVLTLKGSFRLVFKGLDADNIEVTLNRGHGNSLSVKGGATATIRLEKPDIARGLLASVAAQLLGVPADRVAVVREQLEAFINFHDDAIQALHRQIDALATRINAVLDDQGVPVLLTRLQQWQALSALVGGTATGSSGLALSVAEMTRAAKLLEGFAESVAGKIGDRLDEALAAWNLPSLAADSTRAVRGLLDRLEKIESALSLMARKRIQRGVDFEYRRIATNATVLKARLRRGHPDFERWHQSLVGLDATTVLVASSPANRDVVLDLFLNQTSIKRSVSLGLNLGWFYSDKDSAQTQWTETTRKVTGVGAAPQAMHRLALMGSRSREENTLGTRAKCSGQFDASFATADGDGRTGRWTFELALAYASQTQKADRRWLLALADYACVWGVIEEPAIEWLVRTLEQDGALGGKVEMEIALTIDHAAFANPIFLDALGKVSDADAAGALAVALQRMDQFAERASPTSRRATYDQVMAVLLGKPGIDVTRANAVAHFVARKLSDASSDLKAFEGIGTRPLPAGSVAWLTQHTGNAMAAVRQFKETSALGRLAGGDCQGSQAERKIVGTAFSGLDLAWRDRYLMRWQVNLLRTLTSRAGVSAASSSTLKVTVGSSGKTRIITPGA